MGTWRERSILLVLRIRIKIIRILLNVILLLRRLGQFDASTELKDDRMENSINGSNYTHILR